MLLTHLGAMDLVEQLIAELPTLKPALHYVVLKVLSADPQTPFENDFEYAEVNINCLFSRHSIY